MAGSLHVLFVLDTWGLVGGTERYAAVVVPELVARGHRVTVLCREDHAPGFAPVEVHACAALAGKTMGRSERRDLTRFVTSRAPDVIYLSALGNLDALETLVDLAPMLRYVHDHTLFCPGLNKVHENGENCRVPMGAACIAHYWLRGGCLCFKKACFAEPLLDPLRVLSAKWRELDVAKRSAHVLTNSRYMRTELLRVGFAPDRCSVLYYFTQSNTPAQPRGELDGATEAFLASSDAPIVFTPARLVLPDKGIDYLLTALSKVRAPYRAVIAGHGPAEAWLREKASQEGLGSRVHFAGWTSSPATETLFARASLVVVPSVWDEPFGLVGVEAMVHEKPVVAFPVGGIPEWLEDGVTGRLVARKDTAALAQAIEELLADPHLASRMGRAGRAAVAARFPREAHLRELEARLIAAAR